MIVFIGAVAWYLIGLLTVSYIFYKDAKDGLSGYATKRELVGFSFLGPIMILVAIMDSLAGNVKWVNRVYEENKKKRNG